MDISLAKEGERYTQCICVETEQSDLPLPDGMEEIEIPAKKYLYHQHRGSVQEIANTFGEMYEWARDEHLKAGDFKIDIGYTDNGKEQVHQLLIEIE